MACNSGGCHGKSGGQNGFKLSLLGFYPDEDYEFIRKENRGRRIFPAAPEKSLLLSKAIGETPHGGGKRMDTDSYEYRTLIRWIEQGMPYGDPAAPQVAEIECHPAARVMTQGGEQQISVIATYSDGSDRRRYAHGAVRSQRYRNGRMQAKPDWSARLTLAGEVAVMARVPGTGFNLPCDNSIGSRHVEHRGNNRPC